MDTFKRSSDGKTVILERHSSRNEGPFKFSYVACYRAREGDEFWEFVSFRKNGFLDAKPYDRNRKRELVEKHGARAYAIMRRIAEKQEKVPENLFQFQVPLPV